MAPGADDNSLEYQLNFIKGQDDIPAITDEFGGLQGAAGGAGATGQSAGQAIANGMTTAKESVHETHTWVRAAEQAMGLWGIAVEGAIVIWELFAGKTEEVTDAAQKEFAANKELIDSMEAMAAAGVKLTASQQALLDSEKAVAALNQGEAVEALKKMNAQIATKIEFLKADRKYSADGETMYQSGAVMAESYTQQLTRLTNAMQKNQVEIDALSKGYKDAATANAAATAAATAHTAALQKAAADAAAIKEKELKDAEAHNNAMLKSEEDADKAILQDKTQSAAKRIALLKKEQADEIKNLKANEVLQKQIIDSNYSAGLISKQQYGEQVAALEQDTQDKITQATAKGGAEQAKVSQETAVAIEKAFEAAGDAAIKAAEQQIAAGKSAGDAMEAAGGALVKTLANQAATSLIATGVQAAGIAFASAPNPYIGAAEAAGVFAWYGALSAVVGGVGDAIGSSMTPSSSASSSASSASSSASTSSTAATAASSSAATSTAATGTAATPATGGGTGGTQQINLTILLDSQVLLKMIQQASFNGDIQISAKCIAP